MQSIPRFGFARQIFHFIPALKSAKLKAKQIGTALVLTARDKLQDELHALGLGADDYLTKPCNMERLLCIKIYYDKEGTDTARFTGRERILLDPNTFTIYGKEFFPSCHQMRKILLALLKKSPNLVTNMSCATCFGNGRIH